MNTDQQEDIDSLNQHGWIEKPLLSMSSVMQSKLTGAKSTDYDQTQPKSAISAVKFAHMTILHFARSVVKLTAKAATATRVLARLATRAVL